MAASSVGEKEKERPGGGSGAACGNSTRERLLSALEDLEVLSRYCRRPAPAGALGRAVSGGWPGGRPRRAETRRPRPSVVDAAPAALPVAGTAFPQPPAPRTF